uniref:Uncharacterized protein n=1 Tax=Poecilia reticulata TaxID=8081 RepID=A0A3P9QDS6_POERE
MLLFFAFWRFGFSPWTWRTIKHYTHLLVLLCPSGKITTTKNSPATISNSIHSHTLGLGLVLLHSSSYLPTPFQTEK